MISPRTIFICLSLPTISFFLVAPMCNRFENGAENRVLPQNLEQVSFQDVKITDNFWRPKIMLNEKNGIPSVFEAGRSSLENFDIASGKMKGEHNQRMASDSDVYKIIQGVAYSLHHSPNKELEDFTDNLIERIISAQEEDGYLYTYWSAINLDKRWTNIKKDHELYCAGHLFEAAVAYYEVTGKRKLLDAAIKFADHIDSIFGPGKRIEVPGHQEIELALYKLYKTTNEERYRQLAEFFINERGNPERIDTIPPDFDPYAGTPNRWRPASYRQDHLPVEKQYHATGHAVRAVYMYSAMTDLAQESNSDQYMPALDSIWNDIVKRKMYVTAGIGTHEFHDEGFGLPYKLPNHSAYCESCSAMGLCSWNKRMNLKHGDAKYADMVELLMYNAAISSVGLEGNVFFYRNPLESEGNYRRKPWFNPACCPSNMVRFLPEIGSAIYAKADNEIFINQYIGNETVIQLNGDAISLIMETNYPWDGNINIHIDPEEEKSFRLFVRIPSWVRGDFLSESDLYTFSGKAANSELNAVIKVNGKSVSNPTYSKGYAIIDRKWKKGDHVELEFPMIPHGVLGHSNIEAAGGKVAVMRGPIVYCLEEVDNPEYFKTADEPKIKFDKLVGQYDENLLGGVVGIKGKAVLPDGSDLEVNYIPYYSWSNRGDGKMKVWALHE